MILGEKKWILMKCCDIDIKLLSGITCRDLFSVEEVLLFVTQKGK